MTSIHLYQAEKKDIQELNYFIHDWKETHLTHCNFPELDNSKVNYYLNTFLKIGKIVCIKDLDKDKMVGCLIFHKSEYWFSKQKIMIIEMIWKIVIADGRIDDYENALVRKISGLMYIDDFKVGEIKKKLT